MKVIEELTKLGLELTDEQKNAITKKFTEDVITNAEHEKKIGKIELDRDNWKEKADTAEKTLKGLDGKSLEDITKERDEWKKKAEDNEKDYLVKEAEREKSDLLNEAVKDLKFTSESAKKSILAQIRESVSVKNGKLIGFNDLLEDVKKSDSGAFVNEEETKNNENSAKFTEKMDNNQKQEPVKFTDQKFF